MLAALLRYSGSKRRAVAREWSARGKVALAAKRIEHGPDFATVRARALHDARGQVLRHGVSYSATHPDGQPWTILRSKAGRTNQVDLHIGSDLVKTCALRDVQRGMKRARL